MQSAERRGSLLVLSSAALYGAMPILARIAYADGVGVAPVLAYRFLFATLLFELLRRRATAPALPLRRRLVLWALGGVFLGNSLTYFLALERVPVSVMTLLIYTYPVLVTLLSAAMGLEPLTPRNLAAAGLAFGGGALTAGSVTQADPLGVALALATAVIYSLYMVLATRFARDASSEDGARHVSQVALVAYAGWAALRGELLLQTTPRAWLALFAIGAVCTVLALRGFLAGMALVGPPRAAVLSSFEIVVAVALAVLFLGERPDLRVLLGGLLIIGAVALQRPPLR
jgi:drug/metabolite transporter (DMT)-like permease